jgi:hypothetical protein
MTNEPAFKAHIRHETEGRNDYERYMLRQHGEPVRQVTALSCGLFRLLAPEADATTEPR